MCRHSLVLLLLHLLLARTLGHYTTSGALSLGCSLRVSIEPTRDFWTIFALYFQQLLSLNALKILRFVQKYGIWDAPWVVILYSAN